jgi:putative Ca2+/H+ antiporter (TMEM165/GDT1 family)
MEPILVSLAAVALAEIGDKTQLLALSLAAHYRRRTPILLGILAATLLNHAMAAEVGTLVGSWVDPIWFQRAVGVSFLVMAAWALVPDKLDEDEGTETRRRNRLGIFGATAVAFFLVEMGDRTQIATVALGARFSQPLEVTLGSTAGMMLANAPVVLFGAAAATRLPMTWIRRAAALLFLVLGVFALIG